MAYLKGVIWLWLKMAHDRGTVRVTSKEVEEFGCVSPIVKLYAEAAPWIAVTTQALAGLPRSGEALARWAQQSNVYAEPEFTGVGRNTRAVCPWTDGHPWSFEAWSVAMQVATRFLAQAELVTKDEFLKKLVDIQAQMLKGMKGLLRAGSGCPK